jgi:hypothetical protein
LLLNAQEINYIKKKIIGTVLRTGVLILLILSLFRARLPIPSTNFDGIVMLSELYIGDKDKLYSISKSATVGF